MTLFELTVEEELDEVMANKIQADLEEVLGKCGLSLDAASWDYL